MPRIRWGAPVFSSFGAGSSIFIYLVILCLMTFSESKGSVGMVAACIVGVSVLARTARVAAVSMALIALS